MSVTRIPFAELAETRWANGAGRKADIAVGDGWAVAYAWLDGPAPFSDYSGFARTITLVEGDGFVLDFADRPALTVGRVGVPANFDGGWKAACRLLGGPCFVLNAYSDQAKLRQSVRVVEPRGAGPLVPGEIVVVLAGEVWIGGVRGFARDTLRIDGRAAASGSADARIAVIRFETV